MKRPMKRQIKTLLLFFALCFSLCVSAAARIYPTDVQIPVEDGAPFYKIYYVSSENEIAEIPQDGFTFGGEDYVLQDITAERTEDGQVRCTAIFCTETSTGTTGAAMQGSMSRIVTALILFVLAACLLRLLRLVKRRPRAERETDAEQKRVSKKAAGSEDAPAAVEKPAAVEEPTVKLRREKKKRTHKKTVAEAEQRETFSESEEVPTPAEPEPIQESEGEAFEESEPAAQEDFSAEFFTEDETGEEPEKNLKKPELYEFDDFDDDPEETPRAEENEQNGDGIEGDFFDYPDFS